MRILKLEFEENMYCFLLFRSPSSCGDFMKNNFAICSINDDFNVTFTHFSATNKPSSYIF